MIDGPDQVRILLLGSGPNFGYGVLSHQISLGGQLSRLLAQRTGRGVDVKIVTASEMRMSHTRALLDGNREGFDAIVTTFGSFEAYRLQSVETWTRSVNRLLDDIRLWDPQVHTFFGGIVPTGSLVQPPGFARKLLEREGRELNAASELICAARSGVSFVGFSRSDTTNYPDSRAEQYRRGAKAIAGPVAEWITNTLPPVAPRR